MLPLQNVVPAELIIGITGVFLVTVIGVETAEQPELFVTVTVNVPELLTVIFCVVALVDHKYKLPDDAVSDNEPPLQKEVPAELIVGTAGVFFVILIGAETAEHPSTFVTATVKFPELAALTL